MAKLGQNVGRKGDDVSQILTRFRRHAKEIVSISSAV